jgi:hypothetical protein
MRVYIGALCDHSGKGLGARQLFCAQYEENTGAAFCSLRSGMMLAVSLVDFGAAKRTYAGFMVTLRLGWACAGFFVGQVGERQSKGGSGQRETEF